MKNLNHPPTSGASSATRHAGVSPAPNRFLLLAGGLFCVLALLACSCGSLSGIGPEPPAQPTPCALTCPPPLAPAQGATDVTTSRFSFFYYNPPWTLESNKDTTVTLTRDTSFGTVTAQFFSNTVGRGVTAQALLSRWAQTNLDPNRFAGLQDTGPINGAEIGYVAGAGNTWTAEVDEPNAPSTPIFIQTMTAVKNGVGIIFVVVSPLDPANPDPASPPQVRSGSYDRLVNTVVWNT